MATPPGSTRFNVPHILDDRDPTARLVLAGGTSLPGYVAGGQGNAQTGPQRVPQLVMAVHARELAAGAVPESSATASAKSEPNVAWIR